MTLTATEFDARYLTRVSPDIFGRVFYLARIESPQVGAATSPWEHVDGTDYFLTSDARSGFAVRADGELVNVFSLERGRGDFLVRAATDRGATRLDCFDGYLPSLYARHGFVETHREPNWTVGAPDVVFMVRAA